PREQWLKALRERDVPAAPINTIAEALDEPQVQHLQMVRRFGDGARALDLVGFPFAFSEADLPQALPPPTVGEHTEEMLRRAGYGEANIAALRDASAI
ncbi:MAG: CoA transferase, partial [Actinophytocola sp.]|nr:CoA transferase [Actinophytocola sp.]